MVILIRRAIMAAFASIWRNQGAAADDKLGVTDPAQRTPEALEAFVGTFGDLEVLVFRFPLANDVLPQGISAAERAVILGALSGKTNAEIARARESSVRTVANQMASAFRKLGVRSRGELAARMFNALPGGMDAGG